LASQRLDRARTGAVPLVHPRDHPRDPPEHLLRLLDGPTRLVLPQVAAGKDDARVVRYLGRGQVVRQVLGAGEAGGVREGGVAVHGSPRFSAYMRVRRITVGTTMLQGRLPHGMPPETCSGSTQYVGGRQ